MWQRAPRVVFIADRDLWVHVGTPDEYNSDQLILTDGHSIENDVFRDGQFMRIMDATEKEAFTKEILRFSHWYVHCITKLMREKSHTNEQLATHANHILDNQETMVEPYVTLEGADGHELYKEITDSFERLLRGKSLMEIFMRHVSYKGRRVRHRNDALLEKVAACPGPLLNRIFERVGAAVAAEA